MTSRKNYINMIIILQFAIESLLIFLIDYTISGRTGQSPEEEQQEDIADFAGLSFRGGEIGEVDLAVDDLRPAIEVDNTKTSKEVDSGYFQQYSESWGWRLMDYPLYGNKMLTRSIKIGRIIGPHLPLTVWKDLKLREGKNCSADMPPPSLRLRMGGGLSEMSRHMEGYARQKFSKYFNLLSFME
jgi:hypothetical protein